VRRIAKQTARGLDEQADALQLAARHAQNQSNAIGSIVEQATAQTTASEGVARSVEDMRRRARELVAASSQQKDRAARMVSDVKDVADQATSVVRTNLEQARLLAQISAESGAQEAR
jgi:methyl-accepting chemotaxis protein